MLLLCSHCGESARAKIYNRCASLCKHHHSQHIQYTQSRRLFSTFKHYTLLIDNTIRAANHSPDFEAAPRDRPISQVSGESSVSIRTFCTMWKVFRL
jgi:hypothetical protein